MEHHIKLSLAEIAMLKEASPDTLASITGSLRRLNPAAFHSAETLEQRIFLVKPETPIPFHRAVFTHYTDSLAIQRKWPRPIGKT